MHTHTYTVYRLSSLGSQCLHTTVEVDLEDWSVINGWMDGALQAITALELHSDTDYLDLSVLEEETGHSRTRPFLAEMTVRYASSYNSYVHTN